MNKELLKSGVKGFLVSVISAVILLLLFGFVCYTMSDPLNFFKLFGLIILYVSSFIGGIFASRFYKKNTVLTGVVSGGFFAIFTLILSFFVRNENEKIGAVGMLLYLMIVLVAFLGGIIARKGVKRRKKHHKKR